MSISGANAKKPQLLAVAVAVALAAAAAAVPAAALRRARPASSFSGSSSSSSSSSGFSRPGALSAAAPYLTREGFRMTGAGVARTADWEALPFATAASPAAAAAAAASGAPLQAVAAPRGMGVLVAALPGSASASAEAGQEAEAEAAAAGGRALWHVTLDAYSSSSSSNSPSQSATATKKVEKLNTAASRFGVSPRVSRVPVDGAGAAAALASSGAVLRRLSSGFAASAALFDDDDDDNNNNNNGDALPELAPIVFADGKGVWRCNSSSTPAGTLSGLTCTVSGAAAWPGSAVVNDVVLTQLGEVWVATSSGLYWQPATPASAPVQRVAEVTTPCKAVAFDDATGSVAAGDGWLWRRIGAATGGSTWHYFLTPGIIDANVTALEFDAEGDLWVANDVCVNKQLRADLSFERIGGVSISGGGLPIRNLTALTATPNGAMWVGGLEGAARYLPNHRRGSADYEDAEWQYFFGPRWLPGRNLDSTDQAITPLGLAAFLDLGIDSSPLATNAAVRAGGSDAVLAIVPGGISLLRHFEEKLEDKAEHYQDIVRMRHNRPPGFVADVRLRTFGNTTSFQYESNDNDGLWTSMYVASQCFRYALTKDPEVKRLAWHHFEALEFLNNVTGIHGLMARSALNMPNPPKGTGGVWHNSTTHPGWIWKGDTSSDEVTGHLFVYPLVHDLLAETPQEKARPLKLIYDITHYIQKNGWLLIDVTGKPTTWGRWSPEYLNRDPEWYDERGVNGMQVLGYLASAIRLTGDPYFQSGFDQLVGEHGYGINIINAKITQPSDDNFSDDELLNLPYYTWIHTQTSLLKQEFNASISRFHRIARHERTDLWNVIYAAHTGKVTDEDRADVLWTLRDWTWSMVDWPTQNSHRIDVHFNPNVDRDNHHNTQSLRVLPYQERTMLRWNSNPYNLDGGNAFDECDPGAWLLPYWMGRYHGVVRD